MNEEERQALAGARERERIRRRASFARHLLKHGEDRPERVAELKGRIAEWEHLKKNKPKALLGTELMRDLAERGCVPSPQNCLNCKLPTCIGDNAPAQKGELVKIPQGSTSGYYRNGYSSYKHIV